MPDVNVTRGLFGFDSFGRSVDQFFAQKESGDFQDNPILRRLLDNGQVTEEELHSIKTSFQEEMQSELGKLVGFKVPERPFDEFKPRRFVWRKIEVETGSQGLKFSFSKRSKKPAKAPDTLEKLRQTLVEFEAERCTDIEKSDRNWLPRKPGSTSLSINLRRKAVVALTLPLNSGLQFNRRGAPISCADKDTPYFGQVGKLSKDHRLILDETISSSPIADDCRTAFFLVEGGDDRIVPFNIHVDLVGEHKTEGKSYIPIIIDPVVRHPGGSNE